MSFAPDFERLQNEHFRTRAAGQLWMGPLAAVGYQNRVLQLTANDLDFKNSLEAQRFMEYQRKKFASPRRLCDSRRLKMISSDDDR